MYVDVIVQENRQIEVIVNRGTIILDSYKTTQTINLVEDVDLDIVNPFTLPIIPKEVTLLKPTSDPVHPNEVINNISYIRINQTTGDIKINVGTTYTNSILTIRGW